MTGGRRQFGLGLAVLALATAQLVVASPVFAVDHNLRIREVFAGATTGSQGPARFVELQLANGGQNNVAGNRVHFYDAAGNPIGSPATFPANVANGEDEASILVATTQAETFFGVDADLTMGASGIPRAGGQVCYEDTDAPEPPPAFVDCVAWGNFVGVSPSPTGNPFGPASGIPDGKSIERDISRGTFPAQLETGPGGGPGGPDDTDDSAADFDAIFPVGAATLTGSSPGPENNAEATTTTDGTASVDAAGELDFTAAAGVKNNLTVVASGAFWRLTDAAAPIDAEAGCEQVTVNRVRCAQAGVTGMNVAAGDQNDQVTTADGLRAVVDGDTGNDILTTKDAGDTLLGGPGRDVLDGGTGTDQMFGEDQQDTVTYEKRSAGQPVVVDLDDGILNNEGGAADENAAGDRDTITEVENLRGGAGDDSLTGTAGQNMIIGNGGVDELFGGAANDTLRAKGDGSNDTVNCGAGLMDKAFVDPADIFDPADPASCEIVS